MQSHILWDLGVSEVRERGRAGFMLFRPSFDPRIKNRKVGGVTDDTSFLHL